MMMRRSFLIQTQIVMTSTIRLFLILTAAMCTDEEEKQGMEIEVSEST